MLHKTLIYSFLLSFAIACSQGGSGSGAPRSQLAPISAPTATIETVGAQSLIRISGFTGQFQHFALSIPKSQGSLTLVEPQTVVTSSALQIVSQGSPADNPSVFQILIEKKNARSVSGSDVIELKVMGTGTELISDFVLRLNDGRSLSSQNLALETK